MSGQDNEWVGSRSMVDQEIPQTVIVITANSGHSALYSNLIYSAIVRSFSTYIVQCQKQNQYRA